MHQQDNDGGAGDAVVRSGLVYAERLGLRPLELDLHLPPGHRPGTDPAVPLVVFVHGGGWMRGHRRMVTPGFAAWQPGPLTRLAARGFAVASVDYRLSGEARFPAPLEDVAAAMDWLAEHQDEYGFDAGRTVLWGESAGAHLAALLALRGTHRVRGVVDWYGPADLLGFADLGPETALSDDPRDTREARLLGGPPQDLPELAREASPVHHVHPDAPPFLIAHGTADRAVPYAQSADLAAALTKAGVQVRFDTVEGAGHMWQGLTDLEPVFEAVADFAQRVTAAE